MTAAQKKRKKPSNHHQKGSWTDKFVGDQELEKQIRAEMRETLQRIARLEAENRELENLTLPTAKKTGFLSRRMYRCLYCDRVETKKVGRWTCKMCNNTQTNGK